MDKLNMQTENLADKNYEVLSKLFPNAVTETVDKDGNIVRAIDADVLRNEISCVVVEGKEERYQFTWPDKKKTMRMINAPVQGTLRPLSEKSVNFDSTENIYIEGDNLEALKLLQECYLGKVKIIYIDPPYNTGNDFVYADDFSEDADSYIARSGQVDEVGNRLVKNMDSNGRFHTDWLNMMYSRLKLARNLLTEDGYIFISIDDNEFENLKKICNEVFGEGNYINHFAWVSNITGRQISGRGAAKTWESVLVYAKDALNAAEFNIDISFAKEKMPDTYKGFNKDIRKDDRGEFAVGDTLYNHNRKFNEETRPNLVFSIFYNPETEEIIPGDIGEKKEGFVELLPHANGDGVHKYHAWRWSRNKIINESYDLIVLPNSKNGYEIYTRIRNFNTTLLKDLITNISNGDTEVQKLFGGKKYFDYPKSVDLLKTLIGAISDKDSIIMDFFSGSGTTAHSVMELNAEDGGNRKFIMVQIPDELETKSVAYKDGFRTLCDIGEERIKKAGFSLQSSNKTLDCGFRVFKVDSSNMKDIYYNPSEVQQTSLFGMADNIKEDRSAEDLLFQVMLDLGVLLSSKIEKETVVNKEVFSVADGFLIACFDSDITDDVVKEIAQRKPYYVVFRDSSMANDSVATNFDQIFQSISPDTVRKVL
ncbi:MAG: site-specific DNA-methyltransferase [Lachnospiraceae bacterium]|nr:site-specific DNA-methyltransferase [Lachnospiraceae bacterium]